MSIFSSLRENKHEWLNDAVFKTNLFTPDLAKLERMLWHRLFVYNDWQPKQANTQLLGEDAIKCAAAFTGQTNYVLWKKKLGKETFPFALETTPDQQFGRETYLGHAAAILGHLYLVRAQTIIKLDEMVLNGVQFERKRIPIEIPYRDKEGPWISDKQILKCKAFAYIGNPDFWIRGHEINEYYCGQVKVHSHVANPLLNTDKESKIYYHYDHDFEISSP